MQDKQETDLEILLSSASTAAFLKAIFEKRKTSVTGFSVGRLAKDSGIKSRGNLSELLSGKTSLTANSLGKLAKGFGLDVEVEEGCGLLLATEQGNSLSQSLWEKWKARRDKSAVPTDEQLTHLQSLHWPMIFGAISEGEGSSIGEIGQRTGMNRIVLRNGLSQMSNAKLVQFDEETGRYKALVDEIFAPNFYDVPTARQSFVQSSEALAAFANRNWDEKEDVFLSSYFLVDRERMKEFRTELNLLVQKFIDVSYAKEGDTLASLVIGFHAVRPESDGKE